MGLKNEGMGELSMVFEYDQIVHKTIDGEDLEYRFLFGSKKIVFIKVGAGEDIDKYQDGFKRYMEIAERMHKALGATVVIASNPDAPHASLDEKAIRHVASKLGYEAFKLYFWGISDGAYQNLKLAQKFPETVKFIGVNTSFITFAIVNVFPVPVAPSKTCSFLPLLIPCTNFSIACG